VLKGHIALGTAIFPEGTRGSQLDILARKAMWDKYLNYGHGTGHGIGHFLNVHEGPQNIRMDENPAIMQQGMFISNEPGIYRAGQYGIRTENLIHVIPADESEFGKFLKFETLTLFPIDKNLIDWSLMTKTEINWLNTYHVRVYETVAPKLKEDEREWLSEKCTPFKG
jgi:Xaa-Pro aminopeptidase